MIKIDLVLGDPELDQALVLGGEILGVGGAAGVPNQGLGHDRTVTIAPLH